MDISFINNEGKFNYRVCAVIINENKILAMKDERSPYYYLPGGRVMMGERVEDAIIRELKEELGLELKIDRALWLNQAFFTEDVEGIKFHEICLYFLMDISATDLLERGESFIFKENSRVHSFQWLKFDALEEEYFYPLFIKKEIFNLPNQLNLRTEFE